MMYVFVLHPFWLWFRNVIVVSNGTFVVIGFHDLSEKVNERLSPKKRKYSKRNLLSRRMLSENTVFADFVTGSKSGSDELFFCHVCKRDVRIRAHGSSEIIRHFGSAGHWRRDVTYRVHMNMPVYNKLLEPMTLSETQLAEYRARPFEDLGGEFPYPEDLVAKHAQPSSTVPLMTLVSCVCELLRKGGDFFLLRHLWGRFTDSLGTREPQFTVSWSRSETVVSIFV